MDVVRDPIRDEREEDLGKKWNLLLLSKSSHRVQQLEADLSRRSVYRWTNRVADRVLLASVLPSGTSSRSISDEVTNDSNLETKCLFFISSFLSSAKRHHDERRKRTTGALLCGMLFSHVLPREVCFGSFGAGPSRTSSRCADKKRRMSRPATFSAMIKHKSKENERESERRRQEHKRFVQINDEKELRNVFYLSRANHLRSIAIVIQRQQLNVSRSHVFFVISNEEDEQWSTCSFNAVLTKELRWLLHVNRIQRTKSVVCLVAYSLVLVGWAQ